MRIKPGIYKISDSGVFTWIIDDTDYHRTRELDLLIKKDILFQIFKLSEGNLPVFTLFLNTYILCFIFGPRTQVGPNWTGSDPIGPYRTLLDRVDPSGPDWTEWARSGRLAPVEPLDIDWFRQNGPFELGFYGKVTSIF